MRRDDPRSAATAALIAHHCAESRASTPAENAHAMDADALAGPGVTFWTAWDGITLVGMVAMKEVEPGHAEIKSMRTHPDHLRKGVGRALLDHVVAAARTLGYARLSLETGTAPMFDASNRLYDRAGFVDAPAFGGYPASPHNRFMTMTL